MPSSGQCKSSADRVINNVGGPKQRNVANKLYSQQFLLCSS